jgi:hypothetical protein
MQMKTPPLPDGYEIIGWDRDGLRIAADLSESSAAILYMRGEDMDDWTQTAYQTADARHVASRARKLIKDWLESM